MSDDSTPQRYCGDHESFVPERCEGDLADAVRPFALCSSSQGTTSFNPTPSFRFVNTKGRSPRMSRLAVHDFERPHTYGCVAKTQSSRPRDGQWARLFILRRSESPLTGDNRLVALDDLVRN
jgi:hypothetical protein